MPIKKKTMVMKVARKKDLIGMKTAAGAQLIKADGVTYSGHLQWDTLGKPVTNEQTQQVLDYCEPIEVDIPGACGFSPNGNANLTEVKLAFKFEHMPDAKTRYKLPGSVKIELILVDSKTSVLDLYQPGCDKSKMCAISSHDIISRSAATNRVLVSKSFGLSNYKEGEVLTLQWAQDAVNQHDKERNADMRKDGAIPYSGKDISLRLFVSYACAHPLAAAHKMAFSTTVDVTMVGTDGRHIEESHAKKYLGGAKVPSSMLQLKKKIKRTKDVPHVSLKEQKKSTRVTAKKKRVGKKAGRVVKIVRRSSRGLAEPRLQQQQQAYGRRSLYSPEDSYMRGGELRDWRRDSFM
jgi:hypothetical protein